MTNKYIHFNRLSKGLLAGLVASLSAFTSLSAANAATLKVTIESLTPQQGNFFSRVWVGFHDGQFDLLNIGETGSLGIERIAEDANPTELSNLFNSSGHGSLDGVVLGPTGPLNDFFSGDSASATFTVDETLASSRYFSYAAMVLPSNDAFFANDNSTAYRIFDDQGNFIPTSFVIRGADVLDAGKEVNDEDRRNAAGVGPTPFQDFRPNTGVDENGVVHVHPGYIANGNILGDPNFANANFKVPGYQIARITITKVPEPTAYVGLFALAGLFLLRRAKSPIV